MNTGRRLSWQEQEDIARYQAMSNGAALQALNIVWGDSWFFHIARLSKELAEQDNVETATHI